MVFLRTSAPNPAYTVDYVNTYALSPLFFLIIILILIIYFAAFSSLGKNSNSNSGNILSSDNTNSKSSVSNILITIVVVILIVLIIINAIQYFFNVNITTYVSGFFNPAIKTKHIDIVVNKSSPVPEMRFRKQVYNIPGNYYNYDNAKAICQAYGSELATYDQIEKSYKNGSEWCNYGWSADQMALFPTQSKTYDDLQNIKGHEHDCGRPGINGGYIANPNVRFGVNCYGNKPRMTDEEEELMKTMSPYPETIQDQVFQKRVDFWKTQVENILVSPFNHTTWGER